MIDRDSGSALQLQNTEHSPGDLLRQLVAFFLPLWRRGLVLFGGFLLTFAGCSLEEAVSPLPRLILADRGWTASQGELPDTIVSWHVDAVYQASIAANLLKVAGIGVIIGSIGGASTLAGILGAGLTAVLLVSAHSTIRGTPIRRHSGPRWINSLGAQTPGRPESRRLLSLYSVALPEGETLVLCASAPEHEMMRSETIMARSPPIRSQTSLSPMVLMSLTKDQVETTRIQRKPLLLHLDNARVIVMDFREYDGRGLGFIRLAYDHASGRPIAPEELCGIRPFDLVEPDDHFDPILVYDLYSIGTKLIGSGCLTRADFAEALEHTNPQIRDFAGTILKRLDGESKQPE